MLTKSSFFQFDKLSFILKMTNITFMADKINHCSQTKATKNKKYIFTSIFM